MSEAARAVLRACERSVAPPPQPHFTRRFVRWPSPARHREAPLLKYTSRSVDAELLGPRRWHTASSDAPASPPPPAQRKVARWSSAARRWSGPHPQVYIARCRSRAPWPKKEQYCAGRIDLLLLARLLRPGPCAGTHRLVAERVSLSLVRLEPSIERCMGSGRAVAPSHERPSPPRPSAPLTSRTGPVHLVVKTNIFASAHLEPSNARS